MTTKTQLLFAEFLKPVFRDKTKNVILRIGRQSGKTFGATQKCIWQAVHKPNQKILWVDTVQANIKRYIDEYFRIICGEVWKTIKYDKQSQTLTFLNGSKIYFGSAERPENLEGFSYDLIVLNEAGIILKKEGLWLKTIQPMTKTAQVYFIGTPKGKSNSIYFELSNLAKTNEDWTDYHFTCFDSPFWQKESLNKIQEQIPSYIWQQEYLAEFVDLYENSILSPEFIQYYDFIDLTDFEQVFIHADTTHTAKTTSDYFALVVLGQNQKDKNFYVLDFVLEKIDPEKQARELIHYFQKYEKKVKKITFDEKANNGFGYWVRKLAKEEYNLSLPLEELKYKGDKVNHFTPHFNHFKAKRVILPKNNSKISLAVDQLLAFPNKSTNDDFVDGISGCLDNFLTEKIEITKSEVIVQDYNFANNYYGENIENYYL